MKMKMKLAIALLLSLCLAAGGVYAARDNSKSLLSVLEEVKAGQVRDNTVLAEYNGVQLTRGKILSMKNALEAVNSMTQGKDFIVTQEQIIKNYLIDEFLITEAKAAGIQPISDEEAIQAKDLQLSGYASSSPEAKEAFLKMIEDKGMTFDEYWNDFWVSEYKKAAMRTDYIDTQASKINGARNEIADEVRTQVFAKHFNEVHLSQELNLSLFK